MAAYGFHGRLKEAFPSQLIVDVCERCNYACRHCPHGAFAKSGICTDAFLPEELNRKLVDEARSAGRGLCSHIRYTANGEPLLHPGIYGMLAYAAGHSGAMVSLTTNGSLLTRENRRRLLETGIGLVDISLDAHSEEAYRQIRVGGSYGRVRAQVLALLEERERGGYPVRIVVSFVKQPLNLHEMGAFEAYWREQGVDDVVLRELHSAAGATGTALAPDGKRRPCVYPWERLCLSPKGTLGFCPTSWLGLTEIRDFRSCSIEAAWKGAFMGTLRRQHLAGEFPEGHACRACMDWSVTYWPEEGRGYGDMVERLAAGRRAAVELHPVEGVL